MSPAKEHQKTPLYTTPDWIKKKKATINPKNTDDKFFQYAAAVALNY